MTESSQHALAEQVARLESERAILETLYAYGSALDYGERASFLDCFTAEADYDVIMRLAPEGNFSFHGHDELTGYFDSHTHAPAAYHKHITTNAHVACDGDRANVTSYFIRVDSPASGPAVVLASGRYVDEFTRDDSGRWRIRSRRCEVENL